MIIDDFIDSFDDLRQSSIDNKFSDRVNDVDGVIYPLICADIPGHVKDEIIEKLREHVSIEPTDLTMFMRRSPKGVEVPHKVHSDNSMGDWSLMLYINKEAPVGSGTSFMAHMDTGIAYAGRVQAFVDIIAADQNNLSRWSVTEHIEMMPNRALIFNSTQLHMAQPVGGFDEDGGRVILTCFFS